MDQISTKELEQLLEKVAESAEAIGKISPYEYSLIHSRLGTIKEIMKEHAGKGQTNWLLQLGLRMLIVHMAWIEEKDVDRE